MIEYYSNFEKFCVNNLPRITLRSANNIDSLKDPLPYEEGVDTISSIYLNKYVSGISFLDFYSWEYYAPFLMNHTLNCYINDEEDVVSDRFLQELEIKSFNKLHLDKLNTVQIGIIRKFMKMLLKQKASTYLIDLIDDWNDFEEVLKSL